MEAQNAWANAITSISAAYLSGGDYVKTATDAAGELYGYGKMEVLFKPTKAAENPFRPTPEDAMSYFVGQDAVANGYAEDKGFAATSFFATASLASRVTISLTARPFPSAG